MTKDPNKRESYESNSTKAYESDKNSKKDLEEVNRKLSQQIQDNLKMFESLDTQLKLKDEKINKNEKELAGNHQKVNSLMEKLKTMSCNMQELLTVTQNIRMHNKKPTDIVSKFKPETIQKQYEAYNQQLNIIHDVFQSSMGAGNKLKQTEDALKKSSYLLKKSMQATLENKSKTDQFETRHYNKSLRPELMKRDLKHDRTPSSIALHTEEYGRTTEETKGLNLEQELAGLGYPTPSKDSVSSSILKKYGLDSRTPPSLLSSVFEQPGSADNNSSKPSYDKSGKINMRELAVSKNYSDSTQYKPEKDIRELRSQFGESSLKYSVDTFSRYNDNSKR